MKLFAFLTAGVSLLALLVSRPAETRKTSPRVCTTDLLLLGGEEPARLEFRIEVDGQSILEIWDDTFAKLFAYYDRNGDESLDKTEAARLPAPFALRQILWGQFTPFTGTAPPFAELDLDRDDHVSKDELGDYYRRAGLGGALVGIGQPPATQKLTDALLKALDKNKDGKVDEAEWKAAAETLRKFDSNDDELIGPGELVEKVAYPGANGSNLLNAPLPGAKPDPLADALPLVVLPLREADKDWATILEARLRKDHPKVTAEKLLTCWREKSAATGRVYLGKETKVETVLGKAPADARLRYSAGSTRLEIRTDSGKLKDQSATARKRFAALFAECDANADATLDAKELAAPKAGQYQQLLGSADRDGDGKLTEKEFVAWLDLQEQIAKGHILITVLDHGAGLFELLDADHDGSLSVRELRTAWDRLQGAGCITEKVFDHTKLPRHLIAVVSHGHPLTALGKPVRTGPEWFLAMDRNGDGYVSRREFTGPTEVFDTLDADKDGLLDPTEAAKAKPAK